MKDMLEVSQQLLNQKIDQLANQIINIEQVCGVDIICESESVFQDANGKITKRMTIKIEKVSE